MIVKRQRAFVLQKGLVPVDTVCNLVSRGIPLFQIQRKFPMLNNNDVFECIEFYAQNTVVPDYDPETLLNLQNTDPEEIVIEVTNVNETVFLKLVELGKRFYPEEIDFTICMNLGLKVVCLHNIERLERNEEKMQDRLHTAVHQAITRSVPEIYRDLEITKDDLDYQEFKKRENIK